MSAVWVAAAETVVALLTAENTALAAMDLGRAAGLAAEKTRAVEELLVARKALDAGALRDGRVREVARRLEGLTTENRTWLERGLAAQSEIIGIVVATAQKLRRETGTGAARYTARGMSARTAGTALALSAQA